LLANRAWPEVAKAEEYAPQSPTPLDGLIQLPAHGHMPLDRSQCFRFSPCSPFHPANPLRPMAAKLKAVQAQYESFEHAKSELKMHHD